MGRDEETFEVKTNVEKQTWKVREEEENGEEEIREYGRVKKEGRWKKEKKDRDKQTKTERHIRKVTIG
jgi:hypothetical protein